MSDKGICCILNFAPHYRAEIYALMEKELQCTFYFGNATIAQNLRKMDYSVLKKVPIELDFIRFPGGFNWIRGSLPLVFKMEFKRFILTGEPFCLSSWFILLFCRLLGKPCTVWTHGWYGRESGIRKWVKKLYFFLPTGFLLYGEYGKQLMIQNGFNKSKLHVVFNSLAYSKQKDIREMLSFSNINRSLFDNNLPILIFIGRITKQKKLELVLDSLSIARQSISQSFNFLVIGDGNNLQNLKNLVNEKQLDSNVYFLGACYNEIEVAQRIFNADICVSPGEVGLTGIHSLSYGTPVITHGNFPFQMPEFEAITPGETGIFFKENDAIDLYRVIQFWLEKYPRKTGNQIKDCFKIIDERYNPDYQINVIKGLVNN